MKQFSTFANWAAQNKKLVFVQGDYQPWLGLWLEDRTSFATSLTFCGVSSLD